MTDAGHALPDPFADALLAARLCAAQASLGGLVLRGGGEIRDRVVADLVARLQPGAPVRRVPVHVDDSRLLGGLDLTATLASGTPVTRAGLLEEATGGVLIVPIAERLSDAVAGRIAAAMDADPAGFVVVLLDDGLSPDEVPPTALRDRVAFWLDLSNARPGAKAPADELDEAREIHRAAPDLPPIIAATSSALGVDSVRATQFALRAARALATLAGGTDVDERDLVIAARLVLAPRATRIPQAEPEQPDAVPPGQNDAPGEGDSQEQALDDVVLAATVATLPPQVLAEIAAGRTRGRAKRSGGGQKRKGQRGRPIGTRIGKPGGVNRLNLIDTLRAAAPWQAVRGRTGRVEIRRDDLRIRRFETRAEAVTIFAVDASGSSAFARLAEAKGAVELMLAEAYVKRAQVALIAFRGETAELLLPPTRSLVRARRLLADLPGGGGTPLAAGLSAAHGLADAVRRGGRTPFIVVLTDGRANVALDGSMVRSRADADAEEAAGAILRAGTRSALIDISNRPRREGAAIAAVMGGRYLPLPRADAATMHAALTAARQE